MPVRLSHIALVLSLAVAATPSAHGQRAADTATVDRLIEQLRPGPTRGLRMPSDAPTAAAPTPRDPAVAAAPNSASPRPRAPRADAGVASLRVRFDSGSAELTPAAERSLDALGRALTSSELAAYRFRIEGHTDRVGPNTENQALSERRAQAVRDFLATRHNVDPARLDVVGRGEAEPEFATADEVPESRNRRVRIVNLGG